jgi:hypothetical protein
MDSTSTKRSTKGRPLIARRSIMTLSALQTRALAMAVVIVARLRLNVSVWRFGALGYYHESFTPTHCMERAGVLHGHVSG